MGVTNPITARVSILAGYTTVEGFAAGAPLGSRNLILVVGAWFIAGAPLSPLAVDLTEQMGVQVSRLAVLQLKHSHTGQGPS